MWTTRKGLEIRTTPRLRRPRRHRSSDDAPRPSRPALHVRDDASAPLMSTGRRHTIIYFRKTEAEYFCAEGLTVESTLHCVANIRGFCVRDFGGPGTGTSVAAPRITQLAAARANHRSILGPPSCGGLSTRLKKPNSALRRDLQLAACLQLPRLPCRTAVAPATTEWCGTV
jgi:hypothetical protein